MPGCCINKPWLGSNLELSHNSSFEGITLEFMPGYRVNEPWLGSNLELFHNSSRVVIPHFGAIIFGRFALPKKLVLSIFLEKDWKFLCHYHNIFWVHLCSIGLEKIYKRNPINLQETLDKLRKY